MAALNLEHLRPLQEQLNAHPIYAAIRDLAGPAGLHGAPLSSRSGTSCP